MLLGKGLSDYIIRSRYPKLINNDLMERKEVLGIDIVPIVDDRPALY